MVILKNLLKYQKTKRSLEKLEDKTNNVFYSCIYF